MVMVAAMGIAGGLNFKRQFINYVNEVENRRLDPFIIKLANDYQNNGSWKFIQGDRHQWESILRQQSELMKPPFKFNPERPRAEARPRPNMPGRNLLLADADRVLVIGNNRAPKLTLWLPIRVDRKDVGYLGVIQNHELTNDVDRIFMSRMRYGLIVVIFGSLLISLFFALPFAARLVKPIELLKQATHKIASGDFNQSLEVNGHDELAYLARDFNWLAKTLESNQKSRQLWVADISHELRTPIAVAQAEIESLMDGIRPMTQENLTSISEEIKRLSSLVADLHQLSLSDAGALTYNMEKLNLGVWLSDFIQDQSHNNHHLDLQVNIPQEKIIIRADSRRLEQLFGNLLNNSRKYTDLPGKLVVTLTKGATIIWSDSSPGVPEAALPKLFDRLYRVEGSRNRESGGSGLGLAICANIVFAHSGEIYAEKSKQGGLSIVIKFPEELK